MDEALSLVFREDSPRVIREAVALTRRGCHGGVPQPD